MNLVRDVVAYLNRFAPPSLAGDWDNVGLLLGEADGPASRIMTCLTVVPEVVAEAVAERAEMIVSHHPVLFRGTKRLSSESGEGRLLLPLLRAGVALHSPHTAFDNTRDGINDLLAARLGLRAVTPLRQRPGPNLFKLVVFVPEKDLLPVSEAVFAAGAGRIGEYSECSFRLGGTGTFFGGEATNPTVGERGRREEVREHRLEVVCSEAGLPTILAAMRQAHSYEEPAFDVYPLRPNPGPGEGRVGDLAEPAQLAHLAARVKALLPCGGLQLVGEPGRAVRRVAIVCGDGGSFLADAIRSGADAFLTGEAKFHDAWAARAAGMALLLPGHHATERPGVEALAERLAGAFPGASVWASRREFDPLRWV